jgi:hypothetical protein
MRLRQEREEAATRQQRQAGAPTVGSRGSATARPVVCPQWVMRHRIWKRWRSARRRRRRAIEVAEERDALFEVLLKGCAAGHARFGPIRRDAHQPGEGKRFDGRLLYPQLVLSAPKKSRLGSSLSR